MRTASKAIIKNKKLERKQLLLSLGRFDKRKSTKDLKRMRHQYENIYQGNKQITYAQGGV